MAESIVFSLIDKLKSPVNKEAKLLGAIHGEVADIKDELESIQSFLKDADAKAAAKQDIGETSTRSSFPGRSCNQSIVASGGTT